MGDKLLGHGTDEPTRLNEHLRAARVRALMSRAQLAIRLGVTEETVRRWEKGGAKPSLESLSRLIAVLSLDATDWTSMVTAGSELPGLARRLREERANRGITQALAAKVLGVAQPTYAGWEIGRAVPGAQYLPAIAAFLGVDRADVQMWANTPFTVEVDGFSPLGRIIGSQRAALHLTRELLADRLGVSPATIAAWELGHRVPRPRQLGRLALVLKTSVEWLESVLPANDAELSALGKLVRSRQRHLGLRQRDVAELAGLDQATLSRWMHGRNRPDPAGLSRLAAVVEVPASRLSEVSDQIGGLA